MSGGCLGVDEYRAASPRRYDRMALEIFFETMVECIDTLAPGSSVKAVPWAHPLGRRSTHSKLRSRRLRTEMHGAPAASLPATRRPGEVEEIWCSEDNNNQLNVVMRCICSASAGRAVRTRAPRRKWASPKHNLQHSETRVCSQSVKPVCRLSAETSGVVSQRRYDRSRTRCRSAGGT